jgi:hypothetical protein
MRITLIFLSALLCLILAPMTRTLRGFGFTTHKVGEPPYRTENGHAWSEQGTLPQEWEQIKQDPSIDTARLYTSTQASRRADKRRILDTKEAS